MDPYLAIASKRDERRYADAPVSGEVRERILDAGRLTGSSKNRQRWEFVVVSGGEKDRLAEAVYAPENVASAALVVAVVAGYRRITPLASRVRGRRRRGRTGREVLGRDA